MSAITASDRIAMQIGHLFIQTVQQQESLASLQDQLASAQAKIKELEGAKAEAGKQE